MTPRKPSSPKPDHSDPTDAPDAPTFEQAMARAEEIVDRIESGEIGLEDSIKQYEEGVALLRRCKEILAKAEQRVEELSLTDDKPKTERGAQER